MRLTCLLFAGFLASPALAFNLQNAQVATDLGSLLASEAMCNLAFDHDAIDAYVDANVDHTSMGFASDLMGGIALAEMMQSGMSDTAKRAHCRAIEATARQHGFIN